VVLDGVSLEVKDGETVGLLGPSGGEERDLKMINGLLRPDSGDVIVDGLHVPTLRRKELAELRSKIGYVFQYGALFDSMSVARTSGWASPTRRVITTRSFAITGGGMPAAREPLAGGGDKLPAELSAG